MRTEDFRSFIEQLGELSLLQSEALLAALETKGSGAEVIALIETRFAVAPCCGHCKSLRIGTWGHASGLRRYKCKACGRTFNALTGTPLAHLHRRDGWLAYARALVDRVSLRVAAARCRINLTTSFRWRHRFLKAQLNARPDKLQGIVEADEVLFLVSDKGSRTLMGRPPRQRGGGARKPAFPGKSMAAIIMRDRHGHIADAVTPDLDVAAITAVLRPVVARDALLLTDGAKVYSSSLARKSGIAHAAVVALQGQLAVEGVCHIRNVTGYVVRLKSWMRPFNGVATKYLPSYLGWRRLIEREGDRLTPQRSIACALA